MALTMEKLQEAINALYKTCSYPIIDRQALLAVKSVVTVLCPEELLADYEEQTVLEALLRGVPLDKTYNYEARAGSIALAFPELGAMQLQLEALRTRIARTASSLSVPAITGGASLATELISESNALLQGVPPATSDLHPDAQS